MARDYARIFTAIWDNREFCLLDSGSQRLYLLACTQGEISSVGLLPLRAIRWASLAGDTKPEEISAQLRILDRQKFFAVDWTTEEVLVRAFTKWDGGFTNPKRRVMILRQAQEIASPTLRRVLASEFVKIGLPTEMLISGDHPGRGSDGLPDGLPDGHPDTVPDRLYGESPPPVDRESHQQVDSLSDSASRSSGIVLTAVGGEHPQPLNPKTAPPGARPAVETIIDEWVSAARRPPPRRVRHDLAVQVAELLDEGISQDVVRAGIQRWATRSLAASVLPAIVNDVMNGEPDRPKGNGRGGRPTHDEKVRGWQAMKDNGPKQIEG